MKADRSWACSGAHPVVGEKKHELEGVMMSDKVGSFFIAIGISLGLIVSSIIIGHYISEIKKAERFVTVKGVSERDVKADLAVWAIKVGVVGNDLKDTNQILEDTKTKVIKFLTDKGFSGDEISNEDLRVVDRQANAYNNKDLKNMMRYILETTVILRSNKIDKVSQVYRMTDELVRAGVVLSSKGDYQGNGPKYFFSQLNQIKPAMITEATKNARAAATQFASDSGSKVGAIRRASQGLFSIADRDQASIPNENTEGGGYSGMSDPNKRVRVVVTVDYVLEK